MKMTLEEALSCPKGMSFEEYCKSLAKLKRDKKRLYNLTIKRDELEDALDVLEDEAGSERWKRKKDELEKVKAQIEKLWSKM
jgi:hypothetical protein